MSIVHELKGLYIYINLFDFELHLPSVVKGGDGDGLYGSYSFQLW